MVNSDFAYDEVDTIWGTFGGGNSSEGLGNGLLVL